MQKKVKEELRQLSNRIANNLDTESVNELYESARKLYEKLAVLKYIEDKLDHIEVDVSKNEIAQKFEKLANAVMTANSTVPETNPHDEDIIIPGMDTIKHMVTEMNTDVAMDQLFSELLSTGELINEKQQIIESGLAASVLKKQTRSFSIGLNDKIAFVKNLFDESEDDFQKVIQNIAGLESEVQALEYIEEKVKSEFNWEGKPDWEERFKAEVSRAFQA